MTEDSDLMVLRAKAEIMEETGLFFTSQIERTITPLLRGSIRTHAEYCLGVSKTYRARIAELERAKESGR